MVVFPWFITQMNLKETFSASLASKEETLFLLKKIQISKETLDTKFSQKNSWKNTVRFGDKNLSKVKCTSGSIHEIIRPAEKILDLTVRFLSEDRQRIDLINNNNPAGDQKRITRA